MVENLTMTSPDVPAGHEAADQIRLERMCASHHKLVWRAMRRRGLGPEEAADVTQETFLVAAQRLRDIQPDSERAFLVGTAMRVAQGFGRKAGRWQLGDDLDQRVAKTRDTSDRRADLELCDLALSKVNPELAEVFVLYEIEGMTSPEIAALLEIPLGTVASRLRRAREQFRVVVGRIERALQREGRA
jgi:RNA polymerase sigma-70 factor (ECF subfamily)